MRTTGIAVLMTAMVFCVSGANGQSAREILDAAEIKGGLIVHIGCGDGELTAALCAGDSFVGHGLDTNPKNVEKARAHIASAGCYGKVSVDRLPENRLPYIDNLVNLVVSDDLGGVSMDDVMRVLAPNGVAYIKSGGKWSRTVKPRPKQIDEWTHYLHDPQGTMVSQDEIVAPPRRLQWVGGPKWLRNHDFMSSLSGLVSSNGRIFYIIDEGLRNHIYLPARWTVIARDAFNGTILWKRRIDRWFPHTWPFKSGPGHLPRRIVAVGDRVYVTCGIDAPVSLLDAATGKTIRTYDQTKGAAEIILDNDVLLAVVDPDKEPFLYKHASDNRGKERDRANTEFGWSSQAPRRLVMAVAADTGKVLWKHENRVAPLTLAVRGRSVFFFDGEHVVALDRTNGDPQWVSQTAGAWAVPATGYAARLIAGDGVVIISTKGRLKGGRLAGVSAKDGKVLWRSEQLGSGHFSPEDLFLIDGLVWTAQTGKSQQSGTRFQAVDAATGQTVRDFIAKHMEAFFMHQRCYPGRATKRYIMTAGTGTEFLELGTEKCDLHHWLRGSCIYGIMPANGLFYKTPDSCACYYQSKLHYFCAMAPADERPKARLSKSSRLEKGPAYSKGKTPKARGADKDSWPTYRHDNERSGATQTVVPAKIGEIWRADIGGKLSTMTASDGKLFVAAIDRHTVYALDASSGKDIWSCTTGGRVDSPPTIYNGLAVFGCADGWVYCLNASDGKLVWKFRAAPSNDKLLSYQQIESVWPVHGSVLVRQGIAYCLAGRNAFVDGGMRLVRLDCATGRLLSETVINDKDPDTGKNLQTLIAGKAMPVANDDLLSCYGSDIFMGPQKFDLSGRRVDIAVAMGKEREQSGEGKHLFCPTGFLDEVWFHRSYWLYGKNAGEGHGEYTVPRNFAHVGRIMSVGESRVYGFFAQNVGNNINPRTSYTVYAAAKEGSVQIEPPAGNTDIKRSRKQKKQPAQPRASIRRSWELPNPGLLAGAMVLAGENLFLAGPGDVADEAKTFDYVFGADDDINRQMRRQEQAWLGREGAFLAVVAADTGQKLAEYELPAIPVWDGMIAANGRLYISTADGRVLCMGDNK